MPQGVRFVAAAVKPLLVKNIKQGKVEPADIGKFCGVLEHTLQDEVVAGVADLTLVFRPTIVWVSEKGHGRAWWVVRRRST